MKFADVPVSPYTGTSSVSVPFYTIQAKGLNIPISIDYHTGGIRVAEDAGVAGLGWTLNAGGMISRTVRDKDDLTSDYFTGILPVKPGDLTAYQPANKLTDTTNSGPTFNTTKYLFVFNCSYLVNLAFGQTADYSGVLGGASNGTSNSDTEPDSYSYNFLGMSGKFIIRPDKSIVLEKQDNIRIQFTSAYKFVITDDSGNKYYFNDVEYGGTLSDPTSTMSSWHLSKIVTQQNDVITFHYVQTGVIQNHQGNAETYQGFCYGTGYSYAPDITAVYANYKLNSIDFTNGQVQFVYDDTREDTNGGSKLSAVKVYSKSTAGLSYIKEHDLYYSYFNGSTPADSKVEYERLRLDSVKELSGSNAIKPYQFIYSSTPTYNAGKHSYAIDHWGYYNGAGNATLIPSQQITLANSGDGISHFLSFSGANREASTSFMSAFSLQQVTYPTGGHSTFDYSPNYYDYYQSLRGPVEYPQMEIVTVDTVLIINGYGSHSGTITIKNAIGNTNATVNVAFVSKYSNGWPSADRGGYGRLSYTFLTNTTDLSDSNLDCVGMACSTSFPVALGTSSSGTFGWTAYVDPAIPAADFSLIHVTVSYQAYKVKVHQAAGINQEIAGGLRINSITDYSDATTIVKKRVWDYGYTSGGSQYTYGKLMSMPSYVRQETKYGESTGMGTCAALMLFGSSNTAITSVIQGNIVGYSKVTERTVDPVTNADIGKTVYSFFNTPDSTNIYNGYRMPGTLNTGYHLNGSMLSKQVYRNTGGAYFKVNETYNYYHTANRVDYYGLKYELTHPDYQPGVCGPGLAQGVPVQLYGFFYPLLRSERILQDSTREIVYDQNDTTKYLQSSSKSYYDNPAHYQVTRSVSTDSRGNTHVSKVTYPQDYISGSNTGNAVLDSLIGRNMVASAIEKRDSLYYSGSSTGYVTGASLSRYRQLTSGTMVADKQYKLDVPNPVNNFAPMSVSGSTVNQDSRYRQLISFDAYDAKNNIAQYTVTGQLPVSIYWDYRGMLPVAQVKNADTLSFAYTSFEGESMGHWSVASALRDSLTKTISGIKSYNLSNGAISKSGLTSTTTYIISYWTKSATPLTITGTVTGYPVNGTAIQGWYYHEHRVTGLTAISLTGTGNIDEVRLYPLNAQMQSYTHTPLVGVNGTVDARNGLSFYEYDSLQRLMNVKDQDGNILKNYDYNYAPQWAAWTNTGSPTCVQGSNGNTGYQQVQQQDTNPYSPTYNQTRIYTLGMNTTACPIPVAPTIYVKQTVGSTSTSNGLTYNTLLFKTYSDANCTIPVNVSSNLVVNYQYVTTASYADGRTPNPVATTTTVTITITSGTGQATSGSIIISGCYGIGTKQICYTPSTQVTVLAGTGYIPVNPEI
ncbi:hypothetical protein GCM10022210_17090 [Mucilaginibacter dorajii]|uniref:YD repeat-containing protein n=2 Tax=Mucilaginibacter dorajii TaxID=692994 RepID=A0ABP7PNW9_9SPHI